MLKAMVPGQKRKSSGAPADLSQAQQPDEASQRKRQKLIESKAVPYASSRGVPGVKLNTEVLVIPEAGDPDESQQAVECRHLSYVFAMHGSKKRSLFTVFSQEAGIRTRFDTQLKKIESEFEDAIRNAPQGCKHVITSENFGQYLQSVARVLTQAPRAVDSPAQANCLLVTTDHAMALHLEKKYKDGVQYFAGKVYDPNDTASYKRVEQFTAEGFADLRLEDFLGASAVRGYALDSTQPLLMAAVGLDHSVEPSMARTVHANPVGQMHIALAYGLHHDVAMILDAARDNLTDCPLFDILQARSDAHEAPGLFVALEYGMAGSVRVFVDFVLGSSALTPDQKFNLLQASDDLRVPGLHLALQNGHRHAISEFIHAVSSTDALSKQQKMALLEAQFHDGTPGLFAAFENDQAESVKAFSDTVHSATWLSASEKVRLLLAIADNGGSTTGLYMAFQDGSTETVCLFTESVLSARSLSSTQKFKLLQAQSFNGVPGLNMAFQEGHTDTVQAFTHRVLGAVDLSEKEKVSLLRAKGRGHASGLAAARHFGQLETAEVFTQAVLNSSHLGEDSKRRLLK